MTSNAVEEGAQEVRASQDGQNPMSSLCLPGQTAPCRLLALLSPAQASEHLPTIDRQLDPQMRESWFKGL